MEKVAQLCKRLQDLKAVRLPLEKHWKECYQYGAPERQQAFDGSDITNTRNNQRAELLDSTASEAVLILVSSLISGTTPANAIWFKAVPDGLDDASEMTEGKRWLEKVCHFIWTNIHGANFDSEIFDLILDYVVAGWGVMFEDIDRKANGGYVFQTWPIAECYLASTRQDGIVDTIYRQFEMTASALISEYGENKVSDAVKDAYKNNPDKRFKVLFAIEPRPDFKPSRDGRPLLAKKKAFATYHVEVDTKTMLKESGYDEFPCAVPRFRKIPGSVYGVGAMSTALPDAKQLNKILRDYTRSLEIGVLGMWIGADDGIFNPRTVRLGGGKIITAAATDSLKRLDAGNSIQISDEGINRLQAGIRKKLMADALQPASGPNMTATEVHVRVDLIRQQLGPLYGRSQSELLEPLLERSFGLAYRSGVFSKDKRIGEAPEDLQGRSMSFKFTSPLARAQQLEDVSAIERHLLLIGQVAKDDPSVLDNIDFDAVAQVSGARLGTPPSILRTAEAIQAIREQRAQLQQAAAMQEQQAVATQQMTNALAKGVENQLTSETMQ
ncbi:portal protein [Acinetobacter radioresistens]|uniref:portal protein n=1 Tax=Acinetobacter radioresistens TaxID=40216 RepID=UPI00321316E5